MGQCAVNLVNATLLQHKARAPSGIGGAKNYASPVAMSARCFLDLPTRRQRVEIGGAIEDATAVLLVYKTALPDGFRPADEDVLNIQVDRGSAVDHEVVHTIDRQDDPDIAHFEVYLRVV